MPGVWVVPGGIVEAGEDPAETARRELTEEVGIELPADAELVAWSRWITPEVVPVRFDTHFFVALAPPHAPPKPDGVEITDAAWFAPRKALDSHRAGELSLVFPTIRNLERLARDTQFIGSFRNTIAYALITVSSGVVFGLMLALSLVFPTIRSLERLAEHEDAEAVLATARETVVEPILPRVAGTREDHRVLLPGDDGYDEAAADVDTLPS